MVDCDGDVPVLEERDKVVNVLYGAAASGNKHRLFGLGDPLDQEPVVQIRAGDFDNRNAKFAAEVYGFLVEGRRHWNAGSLPDSFDQDREFLFGKMRVARLLDIADVGAVGEVFVDEAVHIAELQLDCGAHVVEADYLGKHTYNLQAPLNTSEMVISHLKHKEVFENISVDH